jgi:hypothetical protein
MIVAKHLSAIEPVVPTRPPTRAVPRTRSRSRALSVVAFTAASAFVLVTAIDPYSGATASPYFQVAGDRFGGEKAQIVTVAGTYTNTVSRDNYTVTEKPKPPPPPAAAPVKKFSAPSAAVPDPGSAKGYAYGAVAARGWGEDQYNCLVSLWNRESGWRVNAMNSSSGAYGIPQSLPGSKMASAGADWETNAATQIDWGLGYISGRYGTPCGAWAHSEDAGWY